jgi:hypothetical protein
MTTSRTDFNETWLTETPEGLGDFDLFDMIEHNIKDRIKYGSNVIELANGLKKIDGTQVKYYWYEKNGDIILGAELSVKPQALVVNALAKNKKYKGTPYATDLYDAILKDSGRSIRLVSDNEMSNKGLNVWIRLLNMGHNISLYDRDNPGQTFKTIETEEELRSYFKDGDRDYKRYQYILSESLELVEVRSFFNLRRYRELVPGMSLDD